MSSISAINPPTRSAIPAATPAPTNTATATSASNSSQTLTQQDFLKIMVAQFTQQDPLASGDGSSSSGTSDYVNQLMAMTNLTTIQTMSGQQAQQLAETLPGSTVQLTDANGNAVSGTVQSTQINNGALYLTVNNKQYLSTELTGVTATAAQAAAAAAAQAASTSTTSTTSTTTP